MRRIDHPLLSQSLGSQRTLTSLHFGKAGSAAKAYIQASLHAEELPGMLVAHYLRSLLESEEGAGNILGEIILVPAANPIGLAQRLDHKPMGRFELGSSENFNRNYPALAKEVWSEVKSRLTDDLSNNRTCIRQAVRDFLDKWAPATELQSLRKTLLLLASDADFVLDLHCDCEAVLHLYSEEACWHAIEPLARLLACQAVLIARNSGGAAFDETLSGLWWQIAEMAQAEGLKAPIPQACASTTVELRGEADVSHHWARTDAQAILRYLRHVGVLANPPAMLAALPCTPTPMTGSQTLTADCPGVLVYIAELGESLRAGDLVADIVDPVSGRVHAVYAGVTGVFYARIRNRYVTTGAEIGKIAGHIPFRTGDLLGA